MAQHLVKCYYCNQTFDASNEEYVKPVKNRYAHKECAKKEELKKAIISQIHTKMQGLLGDNYNRTKIDRSIKSMVKDGKTEVGILRTLEYWYDIKGNSAEKANGGISIVDWVYGDAMNYYDKQKKYQQQLGNVNLKDYIDETKVIKVHPKPIRRPVGVKLFKLE